MGNVSETPAPAAGKDAPAVVQFDAGEIARLGKRFKKLDVNKDGRLSIQEIMNLPDMEQNPLVNRVVDIFDHDRNGEIDFREFIAGVSELSGKGARANKLRFAFRVYDLDNDGYITNQELFKVLKMMVGDNLRDTQLQQVVDKSIIMADANMDGRINFEEFSRVVEKINIDGKFGVDKV